MSDDLGPDADPFFEANEGWGADALAGTRWVLVATDEGPIGLDRPPTFDVEAEGEISGLAGCNRYRGRAIIGDGTLSVGPLALTRMLCPPALMALESAFVAGLEGASGWRRDGDTLELSGEEGVLRLVFRPAGAERAATTSGEGATG
jgi:heat shock protein HslJ